MEEKIKFDTGIREILLGEWGALRINPSDPNLYSRFLQAENRIRQGISCISREDPLKALEETDAKIKEVLQWVFGEQNDFNRLSGGISLLALGENGKTILDNLMEALEPILVEGARECVSGQVRMARQQAESRRNGGC